MPLSRKLIDLVEKNAEELTRSWMKNVTTHPDTISYHTIAEKDLHEWAFKVYSQIGKWISRETAKDDVARYFIPLGRQRREEGFELSEVIYALILEKRHLWLKVLSSGMLDTALDHHNALELNNRVVLFFDRAIFYTAKGYEDGG
jgi:hypothetical protein